MIRIRHKRWNLWLTLGAPLSNYTENTKTRFQLTLYNTLLPQATTNQPLTIKALQSIIITIIIIEITKKKLSLFSKRFITSESKIKNSYSILPGNDLGPLNWNLNFLASRSPLHTPYCYCITSYNKYSPKQRNITQPPFNPILEPQSHPKCTCSFIRPSCPSLNRTRASNELFIHKLLILIIPPAFHVWTSQLHSAQIYIPSTSLTLQNKSRRHIVTPDVSNQSR